MHSLPHNLHLSPRAPSAPRLLGLGFAGLLNIGFIVALASGLVPPVAIKIPDPFKSVVIIPKGTDPPPPPIPRDITLERPVIPWPTIEYPAEPGTNNSIHATVETPDVRPQAIGWTHTRPEYPPLSRKLNEEGNVRLSITINQAGIVSDAQVVHSSGFLRLDEAAMSWVKAHWRYRPALKNGKPVPAKSNVALVFKLH